MMARLLTLVAVLFVLRSIVDLPSQARRVRQLEAEIAELRTWLDEASDDLLDLRALARDTAMIQWKMHRGKRAQ
jgi:hypothetical protein